MRFFKFSEFLYSETAQRHHIKNIPTWEQLENLRKLAIFLDTIREECNFPITINSGFRVPELNKLVNGSATSAHMSGNAADIRPSVATPENIKKLRKVLTLHTGDCDQIIDYGSFFHVGLSKEPRHQWLYG